MSRLATKALDNIYYKARISASKNNENFTSRMNAASELKIDRNRLNQIELDKVIPYQDEVMIMANKYNAPELLNHYCSTQCTIGCKTVKQIESYEIFQATVRLFGALSKSEKVIKEMTSILSDGVISKDEEVKINEVINDLDKIIENAEALKLANQKRK